MVMDEFERFKQNNFSRLLTIAIPSLLIILILLLSIGGNLVITDKLIGYIVISTGIVLVIGVLNKQSGVGDKKSIYGGLIIGNLLGLFLSIGRGFSLLPAIQTQALEIGDLNFILVNIIAPLIEPIIFGGILFYYIYEFFKNLFGEKNFFGRIMAFVLALVGRSAIFAFLHVFVYSNIVFTGNIPDYVGRLFESLKAPFNYGILFSLGSIIIGSVSFEWAWHFVNNLVASGYSTDQVIATTFVFNILFVLLIEIVDRLLNNKKDRES